MRRGWRAKAKSYLTGAIAGLLVCAPGAIVLAQAPNRPQGFPEEFSRALDRARHQVETLYVLRLSEILGLNPDQSAQAASMIRKAQEVRRGLLEERRQMLEELSTLLATGAGADRIKPKLLQWEQNEAKVGRWRQALFEEIARILSVEQQVKFLIFDEKFNNNVRNAILELRGGGLQGTKE